MLCVHQYIFSRLDLLFRISLIMILAAIVGCAITALNSEVATTSCFGILNISVYTSENRYLSSGKCSGLECDDLICDLLSIRWEYFLVITKNGPLDDMSVYKQLILPLSVVLTSIVALVIAITEFIIYLIKCRKESEAEYRPSRSSGWRIIMPALLVLFLFAIIGMSSYIMLYSYLTERCFGHMRLETINDRAAECVDSECNEAICNMFNYSNTVVATRYDLKHETIFNYTVSKLMIIIEVLSIIGLFILSLEMYINTSCVTDVVDNEDDRLIN